MARQSDFINKIDIIVGKRIQELRLSMGLSRQELSAHIGVTHQQIHKYEGGTNRIAVGRLAQIATALNKPLSYFFEQEIVDFPSEHNRMCIEVARNFMQIEDPKHREAVNTLIRSLMPAQAEIVPIKQRRKAVN